MQKSFLKNLVSPSLKYEIKQRISAAKRLIKSYFFWKWQKNHFCIDSSQVNYLGNLNNLQQLKGLLGLKPEDSVDKSTTINNQICITDFLIPSAICVPATLTTVVKLDRKIEEILELAVFKQ